jgi:phenylalanine-4-hydroxylase
MVNPIPEFHYTKDENNLWTLIWDKLYPGLMAHGSKDYKKNFKKVIEDGLFKREKIPQLEEINQYLRKESNWRIKPVNGILS